MTQKSSPDLSVIIINYNVSKDVFKCIDSIKKFFLDVKYEIIVIDNNSTDKSIDNISEIHPEVIYMKSEKNIGFGSGNNMGMSVSKGEYFMLVNPDIIFKSNAALDMIEYLKNNKSTGIVGPVLINDKGDFERYNPNFPTVISRLTQEFGFSGTAPVMSFIFNKLWKKKISGNEPYRVDWIVGGCMLIKRKIFEITKGFDEAFFLYDEEMEWQYRINKLGFVTKVMPSVTVIHNHHSSTGKIGKNFLLYNIFRSRIIFADKHNKSITLFVRKLTLFSALFLKLFYAFIQNIFSENEFYNKRIGIIKDLIKLIFTNKNKVLNSRFNFEEKINLF